MEQIITSTIGLDLGDWYTAYCVVDQVTGEELESGRIRTTPAQFERFFDSRPGARAVMEAGTHSPWASRTVAARCAETYVANSRELLFIYGNHRKCDRGDASRLARVGRLDPQLLSPIRHRGAEAQRDLSLIRGRAALVSARTDLANSLRGLVKSAGARLPAGAPETMGEGTREDLPEALRDALAPMLRSIEFLSDEIHACDREIDRLATERYPGSVVLTQVWGVGNLTALAYMLTLEDPAHFPDSRTVGAFLGMVPRRDQSGDTEKELRITKAGDALVRTLLVQCAQRILQSNSPDSDLKRHGAKIAGSGSKVAKRKAVVAVARKLSVLLHALWSSGEVYEPNRNRRTK